MAGQLLGNFGVGAAPNKIADVEMPERMEIDYAAVGVSKGQEVASLRFGPLAGILESFKPLIASLLQVGSHHFAGVILPASRPEHFIGGLAVQVAAQERGQVGRQGLFHLAAVFGVGSLDANQRESDAQLEMGGR
jgi:hypothetical protein